MTYLTRRLRSERNRLLLLATLWAALIVSAALNIILTVTAIGLVGWR